jgi:SAM-dependent methyltransferase
MKITYGWNPEYVNPEHWNFRTPLYLGMPKLFLVYQNLNDKKLKVFLRKLKGRILDAGCGEGRFIAYSDVGVDFSRGMLKRAEKRHKGKALIRASILYLPFKDKTFSAAFSVDVLLHISPEKRKHALKEIERVAGNSYIFLAEHRTTTPFILEPFRGIGLKLFWLIFPYVCILLAFPLDRLRQLKIDSASQLLEKLS